MANAVPVVNEIVRENYAFLQQFVHRTSGIVLGDGKEYLLEARLMPIVRKAQLNSINELCAAIRSGSKAELNRQVVDAMTTNETLFFRDATPFKVLREKILPELVEKRKLQKRLSFWSAASSSGQEAYSLAMMLRESGLSDWKIDIFGTDLSETMVERARAGRYMQIEVSRGLPAPMLVKYFTRQGTEWVINDEVKRSVTFQQFDLRQSMASLGPFDFVFCRNVLIYFDVGTKKKILEQIETTLNRGAYLVLGAAETTIDITNVFERCVLDGSTFYKRP
jgi:chemotaxis protein methyltransferase CheR